MNIIYKKNMTRIKSICCVCWHHLNTCRCFFVFIHYICISKVVITLIFINQVVISFGIGERGTFGIF